MKRNKLLTILFICFTLILIGVSIFFAQSLSRKNNVNPDKSNADSVVDEWMPVATINGGFDARLAVVQNNLVALGVKFSDTKGSPVYMKKMSGTTWTADKLLPACLFPVQYDDGTMGVEPATIAKMSDITVWDGNIVVGAYPRSTISTYDINGNCVNGKTYGLRWGRSSWKSSIAGDVYKLPNGQSRLFFVHNIDGGSFLSYIGSTPNPDSRFGYNGTLAASYNRYNQNNAQSESMYFGSPDERNAEGAPIIIGNEIVIPKNIFQGKGELHRLSNISSNPDTSNRVSKLTDIKITGLPENPIRDLSASQDKKTIYISGFENNGGGVLYAVDTQTWALKGQYRGFKQGSRPVNTLQVGTKLYVATESSGLTTEVGAASITTCTLSTNQAITSCVNGPVIPNITAVTDIENYNGTIYAVASKADGTGVVLKLTQRSASGTPAPTVVTSTPTTTPTLAPTNAPVPTNLPIPTTVPTATPTTTSSPSPTSSTTVTTTPTTTVAITTIATTVAATTQSPTVTPTGNNGLPQTGIKATNTIFILCGIGFVLLGITWLRRSKVTV